MSSPIFVVGMEELPDLYASRLIQAGFTAKSATTRGWRNAFSIMGCRGLFAIYPLPFFKHIKTAGLWGKPVVAVWIGSDVLSLMNEAETQVSYKKISKYIVQHIADSPGLIEELSTLGIEATWVPTISQRMFYKSLMPPDKPKVLCYLTPDRHEFYGSSIIGNVIEKLPDVEFVIVGGYDFAGRKFPNVELAGYVENMDPIYSQCQILLRPTAHDGLSQMVLEALGRARHVIWSMPFPHCFQSRDPEEIIRLITMIIAQNKPNIEAAALIESCYSPEVMVEKLRLIALKIWPKSL